MHPTTLYGACGESYNYPQKTEERLRLREIRVVLECTANKQQNDDKIFENNGIIFMWSRKSEYESNSGISSHTRIEHSLYSVDVTAS